jgi:hypothetical protein
MSNGQTLNLLNRLLAIHQRSFPMYLCSAPPFTGEPDEMASDTLAQIVDDQTVMAKRITSLIVSSGGQPESGDFPMEFTDMHDLTIDFIVRRAVGYQVQDVASITACVDALRLSPVAHALAEEALGMAKGHLESLEEATIGNASAVR